MNPPRRSGAFVHRYGEHQVSTDFARIAATYADAQRAREVPPELRGVIGRAGLLLFSPVMLWLAWLALRGFVQDTIVQDNSMWLIAWGLGAIGLALSQLVSRSLFAVAVRKMLLVCAVLSTGIFSIAYVNLGIQSHSQATASAPERTYEIPRSCGRHCTYAIHQRADGTTLEGTDGGRPVQYASSCALAQRLDGSRGFSWIRVLERSRAPGRGQLAWPIRREECFSDIPLSSLPR